MPSEKEILSQALGRLGRVPPQVLGTSRQRVRTNLMREPRPTSPLPLPDAAPADLTVLRRPFYVGGAVALLCLLAAGSAVVVWRTNVARDGRAIATERQPTANPAQPAANPAPPRGNDGPITAQPVTAATEPRTKARLHVKEQAQVREQPPEVKAQPQVKGQPPQVRFTLLPPGEGKVILDRACGACHRAASVGGYHYATRAQYAEVVARMISMGAQVSDEEAPVLTDYLFDNLALKPERDLGTAGQAILQRACTICHDLNGIGNYSYDSEAPYRELVSTMASYGAQLSEAEKTTLIRYLFTTYGKR